MALIALLIFSIPVFSASSVIVELQAGEDAPRLSSFIRYKEVFADEPISVALNEGGFQSLETERVSFGRAKGDVLMTFYVENKSERAGEWIFSTGRVSVLKMEFYQLKNGVVIDYVDSLNNAEKKQRLRTYHSHAIKFSLQPGEKKQLAVVFQGYNVTIVYPKIKTLQGHQKMLDDNLLKVALSFTATLVLIIINACFFLLIRNSAFIYFILAEICFLYVVLHMSNYMSVYIFYRDFVWGSFFVAIAMLGIGSFYIRFCQVFLHTKINAPSVHRFLNMYLMVAAAVFLLVVLRQAFPVVGPRTIVFISLIVSSSSGLILPLVGVWAVLKLGSNHIPLMLSWIIFGAVSTFYVLAVMSIVPGNESIRFLYAFLGFVEALFITISIAINMRSIQDREIEGQKNLHRELQEKLVLAERSSELAYKRNIALLDLADKGRLILAAGHDAKNFLSALRFIGSTMKNVDDLNRAKELGEQVSEAAELLNKTLSTIIYSSSSGTSEAGLVTLEMLDVDVLMRTLMMVHKQSAIDKGLSLNYKSYVGYMPGDRTILTRVLSNYISNAIKYSEQGKILLTARSRGQYVIFQVFDQGMGIPSDRLAVILSGDRERLRLDQQQDGEGAGLEICRSLALQIGADIKTRSVEGKGSCFELHCPAALSPTEIMSCSLLPSNMIDAMDYEELSTAINVINYDVAAIKSVPYFICNVEAYQQLAEFPVDQRLVLVTDDRSMEFQAEWSNKVSMLIYSPVNEGLILMALALLEKESKLINSIR
jgi:signal transduction histidine kinase